MVFDGWKQFGFLRTTTQIDCGWMDVVESTTYYIYYFEKFSIDLSIRIQYIFFIYHIMRPSMHIHSSGRLFFAAETRTTRQSIVSRIAHRVPHKKAYKNKISASTVCTYLGPSVTRLCLRSPLIIVGEADSYVPGGVYWDRVWHYYPQPTSTHRKTK